MNPASPPPTRGIGAVVLSLLLVCSLFAAATPVAAATTVTTCTTIDASTRPADGVVRLGADITDSTAQSCLVIDTDDVVLDGQGFTIDGTETRDSVGVLVGDTTTPTNVTVQNLVVREWDTGVSLDQATASQVTDVTATLNRDGVAVTGGADNLLTGVTASDNDQTAGNGVQVQGGSNLTIADSLVESNEQFGVLVEFSAADTLVTNVTFRTAAIRVDGAPRTVVENSSFEPGQFSLAVGIRGFSRGTVVRDNDVGTNDRGIVVDSPDVSVLRNTVVDSEDTNIELRGGSGASADNAVVRNNTADGSNERGLQAFAVDNLTVVDNSFDGHSFNGASLFNVDVSEFRRNSFDRNDVGVRLSGIAGDPTTGSDGNLFVANSIGGNTERGVEILYSRNNTFRTNEVADTGGSGARLFGVSNVTFTDNVFRNNTVWNVDADGGSEATLAGVEFGSTEVDLVVRDVAFAAEDAPPALPDGFAVVGDYLNATNQSASGSLDVTLRYADGDVLDVNESTLALYHRNATATEWERVADSSVDTAANVLTANVTSFSTVAALAESTALNAEPVAACRVIDTPGRYALNRSILDSPATTCIDITASDVAFYGQGFTLDADGSQGGGQGARAVNVSGTGLTNVTVRDVVVTDWARGVYVDGADAPVVRDNEVTNASTGVRVAGGTGGLVQGNVITDGATGVSVRSPDVRVLDNEVTRGVNGVGVGLDANNATVANNTVTDAEIEVFGTDVTVRDNVVTGGVELRIDATDALVAGNDVTGSVFVSSDRATVRDNTVTGTGVGVSLGGREAVVVDNDVSGNAGYGVWVTGALARIETNTVSQNGQTAVYVAGNDTRVVGNDVTDNVATGVSLSSASNVTVRGNTVTGTGDAGVTVYRGTDVVVRDNVLRTNDVGLDLTRSAALVENNTVTGNGDGVFVTGGDGPSLTDNRVTDNTGDGLLLDSGVVGTTVRDTVLSDNGEVGVRVFSGVDTRLENVTARDNGRAALSAGVAGENTTATGLDVGDSTAPATVLSLRSTAATVAPVTAPPGSPSGETAVGRYLNVTADEAGAFTNGSLAYLESDVGGLDESTLGLWRYDAAGGTWSEVAGASVDTAENAVDANLTASGLYGVFGAGGPLAAVTPTTVDFGSVETGTSADATVTVANQGTAPLDVTGASLSGDAAVFAATGTPAVVAPGETASLVVSYAPDAAVGHAATLTVTTNATDADVALSGTGTAPPADDTTGSTGGGGGGGGDSGPLTRVVVGSDGDARTVAVTDARADRTVRAGFNEFGDTDPSLAALEVVPERRGDFDLRVSVSPPAAGEAPPFDVDGAGTPAVYVNVDHSLADEDVVEVRFLFEVSQARLTELGTDPDEVVVYRLVDGTWVALDVDVVQQDDTRALLRATAPGLSWFAFASPAAPETTPAPTTAAPTPVPSTPAPMPSSPDTTTSPSTDRPESPTAAPPASETPRTQAGGPGFGLGVALLTALLTIVGLAVRRA
jgi:parallel beta-helix repeat protein